MVEGLKMGLINSLKTRGLKGTIKQGVLKSLGLEQQKEEIDSLYYFLNSYCDISALPPTKNENLRNLQLGILELLRIFDKLCKKHNLTYFLDAGNLLGAYRHKGFIPWDDDMDVAMPREDYDKVVPLLKEELNKYGIIVGPGGIYDDRGILQRIGINYKTAETGIWMDIFPIDTIQSKYELSQIRPLLDRVVSKYGDFYKKNEKKLTPTELTKEKALFFSKYEELCNGDNAICLLCPEFNKKAYCVSYNDIYPLREIEFEGYLFPSPKTPPQYIKEYYGENFMSFPRTGIEHHLDFDGSTASTRAVRHNIDMKKEIEYLKNVFEKVQM